MITTSVTLPGDSHKINLLRALKGAPLSCLHALYLAHPTPLDRTQLCLMTDYGKDEITHAMRLLCDLHGFATRLGRYAGWILTSVGAQLHLPGFPVLASADSGEIRTDVPRALGESDFSAFPNGSSGSLYISSSDDLVQTTTTTTGREGDFSAFAKPDELGPHKPAIDLLPSEANDLIETYLRGCKRATSQHAVRAALARGDSLADIEAEMIAWVIYAESPLGKGIRSPAIHAVSKIKDGEKCPEFLFRVNKQDREHGDTWRKWLAANETWLARLRELQTPASDNSAPDAPAARVPEFAEPVANDAPEPTLTDARAVEIWSAALAELQLQMTKATFDTWVKTSFAMAYDRERAELVIGVRNPYAKQWLENRLYGMIERTVLHVLGVATQIKFTQVSAT